MEISTIQKVRQPESTTRIVQRKLGKVPNNTESTTKLSYIRELCATLKQTLYKYETTNSIWTFYFSVQQFDRL